MRNRKRFDFKGYKREIFSKSRERKSDGYVFFSVDDSTQTGTCSICNKTTFSDPSNIILNGNIYHFDCVLSKISSIYEIGQNQKIMYIGSNKFAIIWQSILNASNVEILKKIELSEILV